MFQTSVSREPILSLCGWGSLDVIHSVSLTIAIQTSPGPVPSDCLLPGEAVLEMAGVLLASTTIQCWIPLSANLPPLAWFFWASPDFPWAPWRNKALWWSILSTVPSPSPGGFGTGNQRVRVELHWVSPRGSIVCGIPTVIEATGCSNCSCIFLKTIRWAPPCGWKEHCGYRQLFFYTAMAVA